MTVTAVLLLLGGGTAVAAGVVDQDAAPTVPSATQNTSEPLTNSAPTTSPPTTSPPTASTPAPTAAPTSEAPPALAALPVEVRIPAIDVQTELITVALNPDGSLAVPQPGPDYDKAAWYDGSPRPGDPGPAVIEGHVDSAANGPSIFYRLGSLVPGDEIEVGRSDGSAVTFVVNEVRAVPKADFPTLEVYGHTAGPELRLITCGGELDDNGHYIDNTVVFAHQV